MAVLLRTVTDSAYTRSTAETHTCADVECPTSVHTARRCALWPSAQPTLQTHPAPEPAERQHATNEPTLPWWYIGVHVPGARWWYWRCWRARHCLAQLQPTRLRHAVQVRVVTCGVRTRITQAHLRAHTHVSNRHTAYQHCGTLVLPEDASTAREER